MNDNETRRMGIVEMDFMRSHSDKLAVRHKICKRTGMTGDGQTRKKEFARFAGRDSWRTHQELNLKPSEAALGGVHCRER